MGFTLIPEPKWQLAVMLSVQTIRPLGAIGFTVTRGPCHLCVFFLGVFVCRVEAQPCTGPGVH